MWKFDYKPKDYVRLHHPQPNSQNRPANSGNCTFSGCIICFKNDTRSKQQYKQKTKCPPIISHPLAQHKSAQAWLNFLNRLSFHGTVENVKQIPDNPQLNFGMFYSEIPAPEDTRSLLFKRNMFCLHKALTNEPLWVKQMTCELHRPQEDVTKIH